MHNVLIMLRTAGETCRYEAVPEGFKRTMMKSIVAVAL
jgi:hypothetical protein